MGVAQRFRTKKEESNLRESVIVGLQALCASFVQLFGGLHPDEDSYPPTTFEGFVQKETGTARQRPSFAQFARGYEFSARDLEAVESLLQQRKDLVFSHSVAD